MKPGSGCRQASFETLPPVRQPERRRALSVCRDTDPAPDSRFASSPRIETMIAASSFLDILCKGERFVFAV
jgi:hypothetical protein